MELLLTCLITTILVEKAEVLCARIPVVITGLHKESDVLIDQIRAVDNERLIQWVGQLPQTLKEKVKFNLKGVLGLGW